MVLVIRVSVALFFIVSFVESEIYLYNTNDGLNIEYYDCILHESLFYCRRPKEPISLTRDNDTMSCHLHNGGKLHRFSEVRSKNISISTVLHLWKSSLKRVEQYSDYLRDVRGPDGFLCQCLQPGSFGKNCEYRLPVGETFEETLEWQLIMRKKNPEKVHMYGDVVCHETLECDSGVLCLDWREICDGIQNCMSGKDEENCDLLEMNQCHPEEEYRCMNGMCIPDEYFLDGDLDCLDWSDEIPFRKSEKCPAESVSTECDDHLCSPDEWSCGDGECLYDRTALQQWSRFRTCQSRRDRYFICEIHKTTRQWTMSNGRCVGDDDKRYEGSLVTNRSTEEQCEYLLKCSLSQGAEISCPCDRGPGCVQQLRQLCPLSLIPYPRKAIIAPFLFSFFNSTRNRKSKLPDVLLINGTIRCRNSLITVTKSIPFGDDLNVRQIIEDHFCRPFDNVSSSKTIEIERRCHNMNDSTDVCNEWNPCLSTSRVKDGWENCLNGRDEVDQTEMEIDKSCALVRRHRFHCSIDQPSCLSTTKVGDSYEECDNEFDEWWFNRDKLEISFINCNEKTTDECSLLRQYIDQSWRSMSMNEIETDSRNKISFRSYCDTFWDLQSVEDENLQECRRSWICSTNQRQCKTGQCIERIWFKDLEWDCADGSDEHAQLKDITELALKESARHDFSNRSYFIPRSCIQSHPFLCLSAEVSRQGFSCFNLSQIGDGHIDCAGAMDERMTLRHCSQTSMQGPNFLCPSTNTCIPYSLHCLHGHRCPRESNDEHWCSRQQQHQPANCSAFRDFTCFDGQCLKKSRCNGRSECLFGEDEYMCDSISLRERTLIPYRVDKRSFQRSKEKLVPLSPYPEDTNITELDTNSVFINPTPTDLYSNISSSSLSPYWCNRGLGVLSTAKNDSTIVCFCPPQYYGEKCEYHADRLSVLLDLDLSQSIYSSKTNSIIGLKLLLLFSFNDQIVMKDQFHLRPSPESRMSKLRTHFLYPHAFSSRQERQKRFFNRSSLILDHPYSIRIELYQTSRDEQPSLIATWKYPLVFSHLPVTRLAKILRLTDSSHDPNPCSSHPCHPNEQCQQLMNNKSQFICLCKTNFQGKNCSQKDPQCAEDYCPRESLCQPNSRDSLRGDSSKPFCLCPLNRFGDRCLIEHDACLDVPCLNNGSCLPASQPNEVYCFCAKNYFGRQCEWKRSSIQLSLSTNAQHRGVVIQFLRINFASLDLILLDQQVFLALPEQIEYLHLDLQPTLPDIVLAKIYSPHKDLASDLYLLSLHLDLRLSSVTGKTKISPFTHCSHLRTVYNGNLDFFRCFPKCFALCFCPIGSSPSPIQYHQICIRNRTRLCFRDDHYLCICAQNHTRVECFLYDDQLDRCSHCLAQGLCLKRISPGLPNTFLCLCPQCHSGRQCEFNTASHSFTLDQLFSPDLLSNQRQITAACLLIFFSLSTFFAALPNNLFSFITLRRRSCLHHGVGHYLLGMSLTNQLSLTFLTARLIHLVVIMTMFRSSPVVNDLCCKLLSYLLTCATRLSSWLPSFVALERVYATLFLNKQWFKQPRVARSLMFCTVVVILFSSVDELVFIRSFTSVVDETRAMCIIEYPVSSRSIWVHIHQIVSISHFLFPLVINLCSTLIIMSIVIKNKIKIYRTDKSTSSNIGDRATVLRNVLNENREMIARPAITLIPSVFSLFSLPLFIISFSLGCQNLEDNSLRYLFITFYFVTFIPQIFMFYLYIYPSSFYSKEWQSTVISQWITKLRQH